MSKIMRNKENFLIRSGTGRSKNLWKSNMALLLSLGSIIFILPATASENTVISKILLILVVVSGLFAAEFSRSVFRLLFVFGTAVIFTSILDLFQSDNNIIGIVSYFMYTLFFILVTIALVAHVSTSETADRATVLCAINSYLLMGLTAVILIVILDLRNPESFSQIDLASNGFSSYIYFGFVTLTTLGYGDITPGTPLARSLSTFTALLGQLYLVIIMALIIGKYLNSKRSSNN